MEKGILGPITSQQHPIFLIPLRSPHGNLALDEADMHQRIYFVTIYRMYYEA